MNDRNEQELDRHIHGLLARAIADAPVPPELDEPMTLDLNADHDRRPNPWLFGGAALATAAAILFAFVLPNLGDDNVIEAVQTTTSSVATTETSTMVESPTTVDVPGTTTSETTTSLAPTAEPASMVVMAGSDGVTLQPLDGSESTTIGNPAWFAVAGPDGRIYYQPVSSLADRENAEQFEVVDPTTGSIDVIEVPHETSSGVQLHDVIEVEGNLTILYSTRPIQCDSPEDPRCVTTIAGYQPTTDQTLTLDESGAWEFGWDRFAAAENGVVVGSAHSEASTIPLFFTFGPSAAPKASTVGLEDDYFDCGGCPRRFTVDRSGRFVGWIEGAAEQNRLVVVNIATGERAEQAIDNSNPTGYLRIAGIEMSDGELIGGHATFATLSFDEQLPPTLLDLATGTATSLISGTVATLD